MGGCGSCMSDEQGEEGARYQEVNAATVSATSADAMVGRKRVAILPFLPKTTDKIDKRLKHGDEVFIQRIPDGKNFSHNVLSLGDDMSLDVRTEESGRLNPMEGLDEAKCSFTIEVDDEDGHVRDGSVSRFKLTQDYVYMTVNEKLAVQFVEAGAECGPGATFQIFKERRPATVKHNDTIYLLNKEQLNYVDVGPANGKVYCRRWERTDIQAFKVSKAEVLKSGIKEELLAIQFEAFDLDGNGNITKAEVEFMLDRVKGDDLGDADSIMANCDPDLSGGISFEEFSEHFAGLSGWTEEKLQHAQALGNVAQRVSDTIFEEEAMVEVLGTCVSSAMMPTVKAIFEKTFLESLDDIIDNMGDNTGEQDGWFFSNNWKMTMKALMTDEVSLWAKALIDSMKGLGTDENSLMALVCTIPERLRDPICDKFEEDYGQSLVSAIESETSFNFKKVLVLQAMKPHEARAKALNGAMVGLGTDETQLIRILCMCDLEERQLIKKAYADMYERDLLSDVESETSGDFKKALQGIIMAKEEEFDLEADCEALKEAMDGWGTDESTLITKICSKSARQMELLNERFEELYSKRLLFRVRDETSGYFRDVLEACLRHPMRQLAESVRYCVKGWGTDDTGLITCLVHLPEFKRKQLIEEYKEQFGRDIVKDISDDTSGDYREALLALINPPPVTWARALKGAMKGLGTADELLINFMIIGKDHMDEVRRAFYDANDGQLLADWIEGDCSGDYKKMLVAIADRSSEDDASDFIMPIYWAQRLHDSFHDVDHLIDILVSLPAVAVRKGTKIFEQVYDGRTLMDCLAMKTDEKKGSFFFRSDNWKNAMRGLLDMPVERRCKTLSEAMVGWGTDEYTLTAVVCTIPENLTKDVLQMYQNMYGRSLVEHIESETSFNYKKALVCQSLNKPQSRARALRGAMAGWGTDENQLIRIVVGATMKEREAILNAYREMYDKDLIEDIESETSGYFKNALTAILACRSPCPEGEMDYEADCNTLQEAVDGAGTDENALISVLAGKTPQQLEKLQAKWCEMFGEDPTLAARIEGETSGFFESADFRETLLGLLRSPGKQLAASVKYCIEGFGTDDTGLCTLLSHLSERQRKELQENYRELTGTDLIEAIQGDTSGDYQRCLCAMVRPFPEVWAEALVGAMKGLGTSDNLLINWMILGKERMDEVREAFEASVGQPLSEWIEGDCSADYKDTLVALANRKVTKFPGSEVGLTIAPPLSPEAAIEKFRLVFMNLCRLKAKNSDENLIPSEEHQQDMGMVFAYFAARSSVAPNLDRNGVWELTSAIGFAPADQEEDLSATFWEWDYDGIGEITWNNFVQEMTTRVNDPNHWESPTAGLNI